MNTQSVAIDDIYELSPMQEGLLFEYLRAPQHKVYVVQARYGVHGDVASEAFKRAWAAVIAHHSILRTSFHWHDLERPYQVVERSVEPCWIEHDWGSVPANRQEMMLNEYLESDRARGFDLARAPLLRFTLIRLAPTLHEFILTSHHLILDGWSKAALLDQVLTAYEAFSSGTTPDLPSSRPFRDFITWLGERDLAAQERYWRHALDGIAAPTRLSAKRSAADECSYDERKYQCSDVETAALAAFAKRNHVTLNTVALGAWSLLLSRYTGSKDVLFGATVSGRATELEGCDRMIGLLINVQAVRVGIQSELGVTDWLRRLQIQQAQAREFEHTSIVDVQRWSNLPASEPLFETLFVFENYPRFDYSQMGARSGIRLSSGPSIERAAIPLSMIVVGSNRLTFKAVYDTFCFRPETVDRILNHYRFILAEIASHESCALRSIPILNADEQRMILSDWNATERPYAESLQFQDLFLRQVRANPGRPALVFGETILTYGELNALANQLASRLLGSGLVPETRVAVCVERGPDMVIALLAIMKAGVIYVPLDPLYPKERLKFMLADSGAEVVLTHRTVRGCLPDPLAPAVIDLDTERTDISRLPSSEPERRGSPDNLAYVIYTSGSTGTPKGVAITHRGLCNVAEAQSMFGLTSNDRMLQFASMSFDASIFETSMALTAGAALLLLPHDKGAMHDAFINLLRSGQITAVTLPPSVLAALPRELFPSLTKITVAGEACGAQVVEDWSKGRRFWNLYGPTETTIWATAQPCSPSNEDPSIGRPIANTQTYVLDHELSPMPIGAVGELFIGGIGLARGYLGRPGLTAERFVPDPFTSRPGARLYRTGDRALLRPNGEIEFLGRVDRQIKMNGFRIEPGEIETILRAHSEVIDALVMASERNNTVRLTAYVLHPEPDVMDREALQTWAARHLPSHMVPSEFLGVSSWPLTANGKIDRTALASMANGYSQSHSRNALPRTEIEKSLAALWRSLLGVQEIGIDDKFFEVGGNSLLLLRMYGALSPVHGPRVSIVDLFRYPTIRLLGKHLSREAELSDMLHESLERGEARRTSWARRQIAR